MHWKALFKGDYIAAVEFGSKRYTMTIKVVKVEKLEGDNGKVKDRGVVYFRETPRGWVLNRTNAILLAAMFGDETDAWAGKRVTLYAKKVQLGREMVDGIRVLGSPDMPHDTMTVEVKLPRKKPAKVQLQRAAGATPAEDVAEEPAVDDALDAEEPEPPPPPATKPASKPPASAGNAKQLASQIRKIEGTLSGNLASIEGARAAARVDGEAAVTERWAEADLTRYLAELRRAAERAVDAAGSSDDEDSPL